MANPFVAEIRIFAGNFAPTGWALCNGQLLPISQNTALFSLLGTTYGGDGPSIFALPTPQGCRPPSPTRRPPAAHVWSKAQSGRQPLPMYSASAGAPMNAQALQVAGSSVPHNNMMPFETLTFIIALQGVF